MVAMVTGQGDGSKLVETHALGAHTPYKMVFRDNISPDNDDQTVFIYVIHHGLSNEITDIDLRLVVTMVTRIKHSKMGCFDFFDKNHHC